MNGFEVSAANARYQASLTLDLNIKLGIEPAKAVALAVQAAIEAHERGVLNDVVGYLCEVAEDLDADDCPDEDSVVFDGVASLLYAAMDIETGIPLEERHYRA
jgi:hypothetical protein